MNTPRPGTAKHSADHPRLDQKETPINHSPFAPGIGGVCKCGANLVRNISIREGRCQACRNEAIREVPGYGR